MSYEQFVQLKQNLEAQYGRLVSVKRQGFEVHGSGDPMMWRAVADEDFIYERKTIRFEYVFHEEDGKWVIHGGEQL